jgi:hypothetical protein
MCCAVTLLKSVEKVRDDAKMFAKMRWRIRTRLDAALLMIAGLLVAIVLYQWMTEEGPKDPWPECQRSSTPLLDALCRTCRKLGHTVTFDEQGEPVCLPQGG